MRRPTVLLCLALIAAFLISLTGCTPAPLPTETTQPSIPTEPTTPSEPTVPSNQLQLASTVYITRINAQDGSLGALTTAALNITITNDGDGQESVSFDLVPSNGSGYDFRDPKNSFTLQQTDPALPYYYAVGSVYQPLLDGYAPFEFVVDFEKEFALFRTRSIPVSSYTVASTDPTVDPFEILTHFSQFLVQSGYPIPEPPSTAFSYQLSGTWLDADGQLLDTMDFRLIGNLTPEGGFNDDVKRNLTFLWPDSFGYENAEPVSKSIILTLQESGPNYHGVGLLEHRQSGELVTYWFNIFPEDKVSSSSGWTTISWSAAPTAMRMPPPFSASTGPGSSAITPRPLTGR